MAAILIVVRAFRSPPGVVVDPRDRNRSAVRIDPNGAAAIFEGVLGLRCAAREQECGNGQQPFHHDLLTQLNSPARAYAAANLYNVIYITFKI